MHPKSSQWLLALWFAAASWSSMAGQITFGMTGTIDFDDSIPGFNVGQRVFAQYLFDTAQSDYSPSTPGGDYRLASFRLIIPSMSVDIAQAGDGSSGFTITDGFFGQDTYAVAFDLSQSGLTAGTGLLQEFSFLLEDPTSTALSGEDVLALPPALTGFATRVFALRVAEPGGAGAQFFGRGVVDTLYVIPSPSSAWLLVTGLALACFRRRAPP